MIPPIYAGRLVPKLKPETLVMPKGKLKKSSSPKFLSPGGKKMVGQQHAGPQKPGTTATDAKGSGGKFASGGSGHMVGKTGVRAAKPA